MTKKHIYMLLAFLFICLLISGCQKNGEEKNKTGIVGTWVVAEDNMPLNLPYTLTFRSTGLGSRDGASFTYEISGANLYIYEGAESETWYFAINGNKLTLSTLTEKIEYDKSE